MNDSLEAAFSPPPIPEPLASMICEAPTITIAKIGSRQPVLAQSTKGWSMFVFTTVDNAQKYIDATGCLGVEPLEMDTRELGCYLHHANPFPRWLVLNRQGPAEDAAWLTCAFIVDMSLNLGKCPVSGLTAFARYPLSMVPEEFCDLGQSEGAEALVVSADAGQLLKGVPEKWVKLLMRTAEERAAPRRLITAGDVKFALSEICSVLDQLVASGDMDSEIADAIRQLREFWDSGE